MSRISLLTYILVLLMARLSLVKLDEIVQSENGNFVKDEVDTEESVAEVTTIENFNEYVATTPKIKIPSLDDDDENDEALSRYEQGLEDYDELMARLDKEKQTERIKQNDNFVKPMIALLNLIGTGLNSNKADNTRRNDNNIIQAEKENDTSISPSTAVEEGRYIKGDPLNGYYDWIITEGSYKFWVVFQLFTAGLIIYSTLAAIYYSKVNPLTSDYDYIDYFGGRSFSGRSMPSDSSSWWPSITGGQWLTTAAHGFQFIMNAIEKVPK